MLPFLNSNFCSDHKINIFKIIIKLDFSIFYCDSSSSVFLHLLQHLQKNDNNILTLLSCQNNEIFISYFKDNLKELIKNNIELFDETKRKKLPYDYWVNHVSATFVETVKWWLKNDKKEDAETLANYFITAL